MFGGIELATVLARLGDAFTLVNILFIICGVALGQFVGAVPGIGPVMAIAIPFVLTLDPLVAISFLVWVNKGGLVGGAIPAVLINTPGTPDAAATAMDGYSPARQGKPLKATKMARFSSVTGDTFSDIVLITVSAPLAIMALRMGPVEGAALIIFAFAVLSGLIGSSITKSVLSACLGLMISFVGSDSEFFSPRLMFGNWAIFDGLPLISGAIGTVLGALPGIGTTAAAFMSYATTKARSDDPASLGKGNIQGIAATESAKSAVMDANLIPLFTLGIPGSVSAALIISAFVIHGIQPGPLLFETQRRLIYGLFGAMILANFVNLWVGQLGLRLWVKVVSAPESVVFSGAILMCFVGVVMSSNGLLGITIMLIFAVVLLLAAPRGGCGVSKTAQTTYVKRR